MAELEDLSARLSRLAAVVPVPAGHLDPVHRDALRARQTVRSAWLAPLIVLVVGLTAFGLVGFGEAGLTGISSTRTSGDFELTLRADHARYAEGQEIHIEASLTYVGPNDSVELDHSALVEDGPVAFGVEERVMGGQFGTIDLLMGGHTTLRRGEPLTVSFEEGAFMDGSDPRAADFWAYVEQPGFRLPAGIWHPYAEATFSTDSDGAGGPASVEYRIRSRLEIVVDPSTSLEPTPFLNGSVTGTATKDEFELVVRASRARYAVGEPIEISAALGYLSPGGSIEIAHAMGARGSPLGFGIEEPVLGDLRLGPGWDLACARTTINAGIPLSQPFWKSSGWSSAHPHADEYRAFVMEPGLRLPAGTWHVFAVAEFSIGECSANPIKLRAEIVIEVADDALPATPTPTEALPTNPPENAGLENVSSSDSGLYWIEIRSDHRIYRESDPIEIVGTFRYLGDVAVDVQDLRPLVFSVAEPVHGINLDGAATLECTHDRLLPGQQLEAPFYKGGGVSTLDPEYEAKKAYLADPVFRLPPGSWHIRVSGWASKGDCGYPLDRFTTEIEITVLPDDAERMDLLTEGVRNSAGQCRNHLTSGALTREPGTGLGIHVQPGSVQKILWPYGYSAWETVDGAVLIDDGGRTVGREGQRLTIDGMDEPGWLIRAACITPFILTDVDHP